MTLNVSVRVTTLILEIGLIGLSRRGVETLKMYLNAGLSGYNLDYSKPGSSDFRRGMETLVI